MQFSGMPLSRKQLIAGLLHEDELVRSQVLNIISSLPRDNGEAFQVACNSIDEYGWNEAFEWNDSILKLTASPEGLDWITKELAESTEKQLNLEDKSTLVRLLEQAPPTWLREHETELVHRVNRQFTDDPHGRRETFSRRLSRQIKYADVSPAQCFAELKTHCAGLDKDSEFGDLDLGLINTLTDRIATKAPAEVIEELMTRLSNTPKEELQSDDWLVGALIILAGKIRYEAAVPGLLRQFAADWDWWNEEIPIALGRMGTDNVIEQVAKEYFKLPEFGRLFISSAFERFRSPETCRFLSPLLPKETDDINRINIAVALAIQFDPQAAFRAKEIYDEHPQDPNREYILSTLYAHALLDNPGFGDDEIQQWRERLQKSSERRKQTMERIASSTFDELLFSSSTNLNQEETGEMEESVSTNEGATLTTGDTWTREAPKVGRNDPCPCGSGKKFKKCCLN